MDTGEPQTWFNAIITAAMTLISSVVGWLVKRSWDRVDLLYKKLDSVDQKAREFVTREELIEALEVRTTETWRMHQMNQDAFKDIGGRIDRILERLK